MDSAARLLNSYPLIYPLDSVIHSFKKRAQIYNKGHSVTEFLFSHENKVKEITIILESTLFLTRYKTVPIKRAWGKKNPTRGNLKDPRILTWYQNSLLNTKNQKPKTIIKIMNMKAISAVMKLTWSIYIHIWLSYIHSCKLQTLTFSLHRNSLGAIINRQRK